MINSFLIEARVKESGKDIEVKFLGSEKKAMAEIFESSHDIVFSKDLNKAMFFKNMHQAEHVFQELAGEVLKPNTAGKTMFTPPLSQIAGQGPTVRSINITLELISMAGESLLHVRPRSLRRIELVATETPGKPYHAHQVMAVNLAIEDNKFAGYDLSVPNMTAGDRYLSTSVDELHQRVIHTALDTNGKTVYYSCTQQGNLLQRTENKPIFDPVFGTVAG